jgi:NADH-quinone oxidoreductase subunit J
MTVAILFWLVCGITVLAAAGAALVRNLFRAALCLGACLAGVAALYLFLEAEYLAAIQLVVYVGGILVLTVFGVMFSADVQGERHRSTIRKTVGMLLGLVVVGVTARLAWLVAQGLPAVRPASVTQVGLDAVPEHNLGALLLGPYALPAGLAALLLLLAVVGAMAAVRREDRGGSQPHE